MDCVFPFFVGCGRSGTTLVAAMFDSHPQLTVPSESYFVGNLGRQASRYSTGPGFDVDRFLTDLLQISWVQRWELDEETLRHYLHAAPVESFADAVGRVFRCYADRAGKPRYGDKTPNYVARMPLIAGLIPEARFVHIIRDGRDVATSFRRVPFGPTTAAEAALFWRGRVSTGRAAGQQLGPERYREVRYEALVGDARAALQPVCDFLDLPFDNAMLDYTSRAEKFISSGRPGAHVNLRLPPTKQLRDWRVQMSRDDVTRFELLAGDLLDELGYERASGRQRADRVAAAALTVGVRSRGHARRGLRFVRRALSPHRSESDDPTVT